MLMQSTASCSWKPSKKRKKKLIRSNPKKGTEDVPRERKATFVLDEGGVAQREVECLPPSVFEVIALFQNRSTDDKGLDPASYPV